MTEKSASFQAWLVVALLWPVALLNYLDRQVLSTLQESIGADIVALQDSQNFGRLMGVFLWVYGAMSPVSGLIADRLNRKWCIVASLGVWSGITIAMGWAHSFQHLYWLRAAMGVSEALYIPAGLALIADYHQGTTRSRAVGIHMTGLYLGQALGGYGALAAANFSWRSTFQILGLAGVAYGFVLAVFLREKKADASVEAPSFGVALRGVGRSLSVLFTLGAFWVILYYFAAPSAPGWAIKNWLPTLFAKTVDVARLREWFPDFFRVNAALDAAQIQTALINKLLKPLATITTAGSSLVGVLLGGALADRWMRRSMRGRIYTGAIGLSLTIPALVALRWAHFPSVALSAAVLFGFGFGMFDANSMPILSQFVAPRFRAAGYGFMNLTGTLTGAVSTEYLGKLAKAGRLAGSMGWLAIPVVLAVVLILALRPVTANKAE